LIPIKVAIRFIIPSGSLSREIRKIIKFEEKKVIIETPLRVDANESLLLEDFFLKVFPTYFQFSSRQRSGLTIEKIKEDKDPFGMTFIYKAYYQPVSISKQTLDLFLSIRAYQSGSYIILRILLQSHMLKHLSKIDLRDIIIEIRENILK
jgi:hypothetical protein